MKLMKFTKWYLFLISLLFISCEEEKNVTPTEPNNPLEMLLDNLIGEAGINTDSLMAVIRLSSMYTGSYGIDMLPKFHEGSFAWAYLTDGRDYVPVNIKCNEKLMSNMSVGQYEFLSHNHINNYSFLLKNYLGHETLTINETNVPTLKFINHMHGDIVSKQDDLTLEYTGYDANTPLICRITVDNGNAIVQDIDANGTINFTANKIEEIMQALVGSIPEEGVVVNFALIQQKYKIIEIADGYKALIHTETMTSMGLIIK